MDTQAAVKTTKAVKASPKKKTTKAKSKLPGARKLKTATKLRPDGLRIGSAGGALVDAVCRKSGLTHREACEEVVGWKQCLPFLIKSCAQAKVRLRKEREEGGVVRYYGTKKKGA